MEGGAWRAEVHDVFSVPLWVREGAVIPIGSQRDRPDYDFTDGLTLRVFPGGDDREVIVPSSAGGSARYRVSRTPTTLSVQSDSAAPFTVVAPGGETSVSTDGRVDIV